MGASAAGFTVTERTLTSWVSMTLQPPEPTVTVLSTGALATGGPPNDLPAVVGGAAVNLLVMVRETVCWKWQVAVRENVYCAPGTRSAPGTIQRPLVVWWS